MSTAEVAGVASFGRLLPLWSMGIHADVRALTPDLGALCAADMWQYEVMSDYLRRVERRAELERIADEAHRRASRRG